MIGVRGRKVLRDLAGRPGRSLLAALAMAAGLFQIGAMIYKYALLQPELTTMYDRTRPAAATLFTDSCDDSVVALVRAVPGVAVAEARPIVTARVRTGDGDWVPALFQVIRDFDRLEIDTFRREHGVPPPGPGEMLIERSALSVAQAGVADSLTVRRPGREDVSLRLTGTVHAEGLAPAWMEHMVPGFIGWDSQLRDPGGLESAQIRIRVAEHGTEEGHIREVADAVQAALEAHGHPVSRVTVPPPGRHPHADQMEAFLFLLLSFGILSFLLSCVLVAGLVHGRMDEEVRQIGILQAIGATRRQIAGLYLAQVGVLALLALAIGLPVGVTVGDAYARFSARILNADVSQRPFPWEALLAVAVVGIVVPPLVALVPILRAARRPVRDALCDEPGFPAPGTGRLERILTALPGVPRPLALGLRTAFLRRSRLAVTVTVLALGGAAFVSALNTAEAWRRSVDEDFARRRYDLTVMLPQEHPVAELDAALANVAGIESAEHWPGGAVYLESAEGTAGPLVTLLGVEPGSRYLDLRQVEGRWLADGEASGAVINRGVLRSRPGLRVGDSVAVRIRGRRVALPIVGIVREMVPTPVIYASRPAVLAALDRDGALSRSVRVRTLDHSAAGQRRAAEEIEAALLASGIEVSAIARMEDARKGIQDHLVIILAVLGMASVIVVIVGALGLASTLTLDVVRRTREIGILGAIGAGPRTIAAHVWAESMTLGLLAWGLSLLLAAPVSLLLQRAAGSIFLRQPLDFSFSPAAALLWLAVVTVIATLCSLAPAIRAARLPVREALAHV